MLLKILYFGVTYLVINTCTPHSVILSAQAFILHLQVTPFFLPVTPVGHVMSSHVHASKTTVSGFSFRDNGPRDFVL